MAVVDASSARSLLQYHTASSMNDPTSPVSGRRPTLRRLRRAASNESGQTKQEAGDESAPRAFKRLRKGPSSGDRQAAAATANGRATARAAVERKEEIVLDEDEEDVPLVLSRPSIQTTSHTPRASTTTTSPSSPSSLTASSDSDDDNACSICLGQPADAAVLDSCAHSFCFLCIFRWCTDICNNCPLCKRRVTQIKHHGDTLKADSSASGSSRQAERRHSESRVKQEKRSEEEQRRAEDEEADDAADDWALIQTQRAENQVKQGARRRGRRQGGGQLSQLSLQSSPTSLMEGIEAIAAIRHSEAAPVTRQKQRVAEQQQIIGRTQSNGSSQPIRPSSLLSLRHSQSNGVTSATPSTCSSPTSASALASPASTSASPKSSSAEMLVIHIPDRQQRASYEEAEEVPSPSILNIACEVCFTDENEHLLLLCDGCDDAYHTYCLQPRLDAIPENEWFCPNCLYEAQLHSSDEQKDVGNVVSSSSTHALPRAVTPRRSRVRGQRLGMRVSPAIRQRLMETPQSADTVDEDYTPSGSATRFDNTAVPFSFASFRPGYVPRAQQQRRSVRQEQLRHQALETRRQQLDEQSQLRAERAAKRREDEAQSCEDEDELDDASYHSASPVAASSVPSSRHATSAPPTAPLSSLHQLSSSQNETLLERLRDIQMQKLRERDDERERDARKMAERNYVEVMLDEEVQRKDKENGTADRRDGRRRKSQRKAHREDEREEEDEGSGDNGRVRRKAVNRTNTNVPEPIIVPPSSSTSSSRQPVSSIATVSVDYFFPSRSTRPSNSTAMPTPAAATASRLSPFSNSPTSSPPSSLSSLPYPSRPAQLPSSGYRPADAASSFTGTARAVNVNLSHKLSSTAAPSLPSPPVVPPARFPYTAPVIPKRPKASPQTSSSPSTSFSPSPATSSWQASSSPSSASAVPASSASPSVSPLPTFEEFERTHLPSTHTSRSPFRASYSPQQSRNHKHAVAAEKRHSGSDKAALPMRRSILSGTDAKHDSEYFR